MQLSDFHSLLTNPVYINLHFCLHIFWKLAKRLCDTRKAIIMLFLGCFDPELCVKAATLSPLYKTALSHTVPGKYKGIKAAALWY